MSCSVIAFSNQKGGVGKSTSVVATAGCLLGRGYAVLVIDTDPQATASSYMVSDFEKQEEGREASLYHLIMDENLSVPDSIVHTPSGDLITASFLLYDMDRLGLGTSAIKEIVDEVRGQYDFILIDTPPNLGWLQTAALEASDDIVIPTKATAQSIRGIPTFFEAEGHVYYDSRCMSPELGNSVSNFKSLNCSVPDMPERPEDSDVVFDKFFCLLRPDDPVDKLRSFIGDEFTAVPQGEHYLEIVPTGCSKAEGIHILQKKLGIPKDNCYAIGDSENDIPMLEAVPHSIAMGVCS